MTDPSNSDSYTSNTNPRVRLSLKDYVDLDRLAADVGAFVLKDSACPRVKKVRRLLDDFVGSWKAGPKRKRNFRRLVSAFDYLDAMDVLVWLSRLRKVSHQRVDGLHTPKRVVELLLAESLYCKLGSNDDEKKEDAKETIRRLAIKLISTEVVLSVSYSHQDTPDVQQLYHRVFQRNPDFRSVVLWVDKHDGLTIERKQPWFEYGLVPYVLCETITIRFDISRTWMLVERAVRDGVNASLDHSKRKVVDVTSYIRKSLVRMVQLDEFHVSRTGWRRDKEYLKLMIMLSTSGQNVFKLKIEELSFLYTDAFSSTGEARVGGFKRLYPVGLLEYIEKQPDENIKRSHAQAKIVTEKMKQSSQSDNDRNREYWEKAAALDAFESYAQGYDLVKVADAPYEITMTSAEGVLRSALRIVFIIMLLLAWDRNGRAAVLTRYLVMVADFALDIFMFIHLSLTGREDGGKDVLNSIMLRIVIFVTRTPLAVLLAMTPVLLPIKRTLDKVIRYFSDNSEGLGALLIMFSLSISVGLSVLVVAMVVVIAVAIVAEFVLGWDLYLAGCELIVLCGLIMTLKVRRGCWVYPYLFNTLCCMIHVMSAMSAAIPLMMVLADVVRELARAAGFTLMIVLLVATVITTRRSDNTGKGRGRRCYAGCFKPLALSSGISERCGWFYLGMDSDMKAHSYFGPLRVADISNKGQEEQEAKTNLGLEQPKYIVALRSGFVGG